MIPKPFIPSYKVCLICGKKTTQETCSVSCTKKIDILRGAISSRIASEKSGIKQYNEQTIKIFNRLQNQLKPRE